MHKHNKSIINQREIGKDTKSYSNGLRAILREDPDVILIGEMRDPESIEIALTAAKPAIWCFPHFIQLALQKLLTE